MLFVSLFKWWYTEGWRQRAQLIASRLDGVMDYFSIDLLLKTLFQPFRQDGVGKVDGPLSVQLHAFADKTISRIIGAVIRIIILVFGLIAIALSAIFSLIVLVGWAIIPATPLIGIVLTIVQVSA